MLDSVSSCTASRSAVGWAPACANGGAGPATCDDAKPGASCQSHAIGDSPTLIALERVRIDASSLSMSISAPAVDPTPAAVDPTAAASSTQPAADANVDPPAAPSNGASSASAVAWSVHVIVNATRYVATRLAAARPAGAASASTTQNATDAPAADASEARATPSTSDSPPGGPTAAANASSSDAVTRLSLADFATLRMRTAAFAKASSLELSLTTQEGDVVHVDFQQLQQASEAGLAGTLSNGTTMRANATTSSLDRSVAMQVTGDLSDDERAAINALLDDVVGAANDFFGGDARAAIADLSNVHFDPAALSSLSLSMSQTRSVAVQRAYVGDADASRRALTRGSAGRALAHLGHAQRRLIDAAQQHFDDASAATLVRQLMTQLLSGGATDASATASDEAPAVDSSASASAAAVATTA